MAPCSRIAFFPRLWALVLLVAACAQASLVLPAEGLRARAPLAAELHQAPAESAEKPAQAWRYCLRARWMDPATGRFVSEDPYEGSTKRPVSLHRFLYANAGPINGWDPSGKFTLAEFAVSSLILGSATVSFSLTTKLTGEPMIKWKGNSLSFSIDGVKKYTNQGPYWDYHLTPWQPFDFGWGPEVVTTIGYYEAVNLKGGRKSGGAFIGFSFGYSYGASVMGFSFTLGDFEVETPSILGDNSLLLMGPTASLSATAVPIAVGGSLSAFYMGFGIGFNKGITFGQDLSIGGNAGYNLPLVGLETGTRDLMNSFKEML